MVSIDTEIEGSPGSIRAAASWLSGTLKPAVEKGGDSFAADDSMKPDAMREPEAT